MGVDLDTASGGGTVEPVGFRAMRVVSAALLCAVAVVAASACIPQDREVAEVGAEDLVAGPPQFPETGEVPPDLLLAGLVYDFTNADVDLDLWVPPRAEAQCAAEKIVENHGKRLSDVGYEPARTGASLNDVALRPDERDSVASLFRSCVNTVEMMASLLRGGSHMTAPEAMCMAEGLDSSGVSSAIIDNWMLGASFDPIGEDGLFAAAMLAYTEVCLPDTAFTWFGFELPGDTEVQEAEGEGDSEGDLPGSAGNETTTTLPGAGG